MHRTETLLGPGEPFTRCKDCRMVMTSVEQAMGSCPGPLGLDVTVYTTWEDFQRAIQRCRPSPRSLDAETGGRNG